MSPYSNSARGTCRARGFSLLEVLVAFVIMVLALGVIMRIVSQGMSRVGESEYHARAVMLAESTLAQVGTTIALEEGESGGESEGALRWHVRIGAYEPEPRKPETAGDPREAVLPVRLLRVEVKVTWDEHLAAPRSVRYATLRLAPRSVR